MSDLDKEIMGKFYKRLIIWCVTFALYFVLILIISPTPNSVGAYMMLTIGFIMIGVFVVITGLFIAEVFRAENAYKYAEKEKAEVEKKVKSEYESYIKNNGLTNQQRLIDSQGKLVMSLIIGASISSTHEKPSAPVYTEGLYKGSLADNISVLANAQKKENYEKALIEYNNRINNDAKNLNRLDKEMEYYDREKDKLINALKSSNAPKEMIDYVEKNAKEIHNMYNKIASMQLFHPDVRMDINARR